MLEMLAKSCTFSYFFSNIGARKASPKLPVWFHTTSCTIFMPFSCTASIRSWNDAPSDSYLTSTVLKSNAW